jgi:hypothetical protein
MDASEIERVLTNWIAQAVNPPGELRAGIDPAAWIAQQFLRWWKLQVDQVDDDLGAAETAVSAVRQELLRLGGWSNPEFGEALHELTHASEALTALRCALSPLPPSAQS